jgi:hypothetical protein
MGGIRTVRQPGRISRLQGKVAEKEMLRQTSPKLTAEGVCSGASTRDRRPDDVIHPLCAGGEHDEAVEAKG